MENLLNRAVALAKAGDKATARRLLRQIVAENPQSETAWGWLAHCAETKTERRQALERVVEINPANQRARAALEKMGPVMAPMPVQPPTPVPVPVQLRPQPPTPITDDSYLLDREIARLTGQGWQVVNRTPTGAQLRKPKQWSKGLLVLGLITIPFAGFGFLVLIIALIDYLIKKDQLAYVTAQDVRLDTVETPSTWRKPAMLALAIMGLFAFVLLCVLVIMPLIVNAL